MISAIGKRTSPLTTLVGEAKGRCRISNGSWKTLRIIVSSYKNTGGCQVRSKPGNPQLLEKDGLEFGTQQRRHRQLLMDDQEPAYDGEEREPFV
eukprot:2441863-Heterocapsa_arctica.AAC.1